MEETKNIATGHLMCCNLRARLDGCMFDTPAPPPFPLDWTFAGKVTNVGTAENNVFGLRSLSYRKTQ